MQAAGGFFLALREVAVPGLAKSGSSGHSFSRNTCACKQSALISSGYVTSQHKVDGLYKDRSLFSYTSGSQTS